MRVVVIGTGYVGLVSGACLAEIGHQVVCIDSHQAKIEGLQKGVMPIFEPGLEELVYRNVAAGSLKFDTSLAEHVPTAEVVFIAVGTPTNPRDGRADLSQVTGVALQVAPLLDHYTCVVTKSTVPVGTGDAIEAIMKTASKHGQFAVVSNPEFLREGQAIDDFLHPDRIVVGYEDARARGFMQELYRPITLTGIPMLCVGRRTAELTKYAANAFLAMKVAYINEMADLCEAAGANVEHVAKGIGLDRRIGAKFLKAGPGFGGSCFPKDTLALVMTARDHEVPLDLVNATLKANFVRKASMANKIEEAVCGNVDGARIAVLGLTFKAGTDDIRDSPALEIIPALVQRGAEVRMYDPQATSVEQLLWGAKRYPSIEECVRGCEGIVILTDWPEFRNLDLGELRALVATSSPALVDLRNIFEPEEARDAGFHYASVGRP